MKLPGLFLLIDSEDALIKAVFHGTLQDKEIALIMKELNGSETGRIKLEVIEKYFDAGFHYTILSLHSEDNGFVKARLGSVFSEARKISLKREQSIRDAVRAIVVM